MAAGIASGFVRKLYRILDQESDEIIGWDVSGLSFSIHDSMRLNESVLPRYFRGRMSAFRQQLLDHGFEQIECEDNEARECYAHPHFLRGVPDRLSFIVRNPKPKIKPGHAPQLQPPPQVQHQQHQANHQQQQQYHQPQQLQQQLQQQQQEQQPYYQTVNGQTTTVLQQQQQVQQPSLGIRIAPSNRGPGRTPLTVTLTRGKRASPSHATAGSDFSTKRFRGAMATTNATSPMMNHLRRPTGPVQAPTPPANLSRNPLFSNDSSTELGLDVARVFSLSRISDSGLLPHSTDLPEPISYLTKLLHGGVSDSGLDAMANEAHAQQQRPSSSSSVSSSATPSIDTPVFSEDLMKSALYFLVSTSTTGMAQVPPPAVPASGAAAAPSGTNPNTWAAHMEKLSTSGFLSSLLVSSATGKDTGSHNAGGAPPSSMSPASVWGSSSSAAANPLFSKSSDQDDEEEDSIWNLLLASSIDRVKTAIQDVVTPQERLQLILEEREKLEEQRKRIYGLNNAAASAKNTSGSDVTTTSSGPHKPPATQSAKPLKSALKKPTAAPLTINTLFAASKNETTSANPLFQKSTTRESANPLFARPSSSLSRAANPLFAADDDDDDDEDDGDDHDYDRGDDRGGRGGETEDERTASHGLKMLCSKPTTSVSGSAPASVSRLSGGVPSNAEDGLWRLLMTSSVDWMRKGAAEFEV